jgi:hypothetical protein
VAKFQTWTEGAFPNAAGATTIIDAKALKTLVPTKAMPTLPIMAE